MLLGYYACYLKDLMQGDLRYAFAVLFSGCQVPFHVEVVLTLLMASVEDFG